MPRQKNAGHPQSDPQFVRKQVLTDATFSGDRASIALSQLRRAQSSGGRPGPIARARSTVSATARPGGPDRDAVGWLRERGERAGLNPGPVGAWTRANKRLLRIGVVALAALIFVFWGQPTLAVAIWIVVLLLVALGLIELIGGRTGGAETAIRP